MRRGWLVVSALLALLLLGVPAGAATHRPTPKPSSTGSSSGGGTDLAVYAGAVVAGAVLLGLVGLYGLYRTRDPLRR